MERSGNFADYSIPFILSIVFCWSDASEPHAIVALSTYPSKAPEESNNTVIEHMCDEKALIMRFFEVLQEHKPDIISGFNDNSFDWVVMMKRARHYGLTAELYNSLSLEMLFDPSALRKRDFNIRPYMIPNKIKIKGDEYIKCNFFTFRGTIAVDTMCLFRKLYPDDDRYSLNHFLGKLELPLKEDVSYV